MREKKTIDHVGIVKSITPTHIDVEILNKSACTACHAKSACTMSDVSAKIIRVVNPINEHYQEGEEVLVVMKKSMGLKAVLISYVIPLIVLLILLVSLPHLNLNELCTALLAVLGLSGYYLIIFFCKGLINKEFTFTIEKNNKHQF